MILDIFLHNEIELKKTRSNYSGLIGFSLVVYGSVLLGQLIKTIWHDTDLSLITSWPIYI